MIRASRSKSCCRVVCVAALALGTFSLLADAGVAEPLAVKVMTFNIRRSGEEKEAQNQWTERRDLVVGVIRRFEGDFVGIQEAKPNQVADLNRLLPDYRSIALSREADPTVGEAVPIYYRSERWTLDEKQTGTFWLSDTPEVPGSKSWQPGYPRIVTWGRFVEQATGRAVYVYNTHFDTTTPEAREKSVHLLAERVAQAPKTDPVVVMGDFNSAETSDVVKLLTGKLPGLPLRFCDTFRAVHPNAKEFRTAHEFHGATVGEKIDYILVRPNAQVKSSRILHDHQGDRYPSDHYPLTAEVVLP